MKNSLPWLGGIVISGLNSQFLFEGYFFSKLISIAVHVILSMSDTTVIKFCNNSLRSIRQYYQNINMRDLLQGYTKTI